MSTADTNNPGVRESAYDYHTSHTYQEIAERTGLPITEIKQAHRAGDLTKLLCEQRPDLFIRATLPEQWAETEAAVERLQREDGPFFASEGAER